MIYIGIDPGTHTGVAIWDNKQQEFIELATIPIHQALLKVKNYYNDNKGLSNICVVFEDARQRTWFGRDKNTYAKLQGAGSIKRDCSIWEDMHCKATEAAARLTESRQEAARHVTEQLLAQMTSLGMPNARFEIKFETKELAVDGADRISYMFSANKNVPLEPIAQVASGGEVARVMLSLKAMISGAVKLPTIIFDEIDTGVSGRVAEMMAQIMRQMGRADRQVISITHLPQIAALGTTHYKVEKTDTDDTTISRMRMLGHDERITEIAQMLSGSNISDAAIENAKSLLEK